MQAKPEEKPQIEKYDSLRNFKHQKYGDRYTFHHLIGQTIMWCGYPYYTHKKYPFTVGKYYRIDDILPDDVGKGLYDRMVLTELETGKIFHTGDIGADKVYNFTWIVQGYYEKMKSQYVGRDFVFISEPANSYLNDADRLINLDTDTITRNIKKLSVWKCVDVQVKPRIEKDHMDVDYRNTLVLIFDNDVYGKHYCYTEDRTGNLLVNIDAKINGDRPYLCGRFQDKQQYDLIQQETKLAAQKRKTAMVKKYGTNNGALIAEGRVRIGMTKAMCRDAWGEPYDINTTTGSWGVHEQWVYGSGSYLYFENGKLTSIQN